MKMFTILLCSVFLNTVSAFAQTPPIDDCPAGHQLHASLTPLDHDAMVASYTASFVGLFHRSPSMAPGSGSDDGNYWISLSNHYGLYGDDVCRAGWNLYRERQLGNIPTGPRDGDLPAQFQPGYAPPAPPVYVPPAPTPIPPTPVAACDLTPVLTQLINLNGQVNACNVGIANVDQNVSDGRKENQTFFSNVKSAWETIGGPFLVKYVLPAVAAYFAGKKL